MHGGNEDLRRRQTSRLWYRRPLGAESAQEAAMDTDQVIAHSSENAVDRPRPVTVEATEDEYAYFDLDVAGMKLRTLNFNDPHVRRSLHAVNQTSWRSYPTDTPALTLSATENLQTRLMGPVLNPGIRYRVVDCY